MKTAFISSSYRFITKHKELDHYNEVKIKYGLEVMYSFVTKTIAIVLMSFFCGFLIENIYIFLFYGILRTFAHGVHAKSNKHCWISTLLTYFITGMFCKYIKISKRVMYSVCIISTLLISLYAPSDTVYRPIRKKEKRIKLKIKAILSCILFLCAVLFTKFKYKNSIFTSFILCVISINPITYKVLKTPRNNYRN